LQGDSVIVTETHYKAPLMRSIKGALLVLFWEKHYKAPFDVQDQLFLMRMN
jgi:hypothetical protein